MPRYTPWTIAGICMAVTIGTIAALCEVVLCNPRLTGLFPRGWKW